ncbi:M24 family metallopeptidase, partial [Candidatus Gracilibacteria bacterium]|nr:M24 family metallopeptidase [Candidatus Gracilibacteria bacterium]
MKSPTLLYTNEDDHGYTNPSFRYLLGFQPSSGYMLLTQKKLHIILNPLYFEKLSTLDIKHIKKIIGKKEIHTHLLDQPLTNILKKITKSSTLTLEDSVPLNFYQSLEKNYSLSTTKNIFAEARKIKHSQEIKCIRKAIEMIQKVYADIETLNHKGKIYGKTELEIRQYIIERIFAHGGEGEGFDSIVAFGSNSAIPHHTAGSTLIQEGVLLIDMGALYQGYSSDFSRTFWVKKPSIFGTKKVQNKELYKEFLQVKSIVAEAQKRAMKKSKKGNAFFEIDAAAREYIIQQGYGEEFIHSTGHG